MNDVDVIHDVGWARHPQVEEEHILARGASSPVLLEVLDFFEWTCYARSPGYAWGAVDVDAKDSQEPVIRLHIGGELEISVAGDPEHLGIGLRVMETRRGVAPGSSTSAPWS